MTHAGAAKLSAVVVEFLAPPPAGQPEQAPPTKPKLLADSLACGLVGWTPLTKPLPGGFGVPRLSKVGIVIGKEADNMHGMR